MTLKIKNNNPWNCNVKRLLDGESLARKYLTLSLKFLVMHINRTIILGQTYPGGRTIILGRREYLSNRRDELKLTIVMCWQPWDVRFQSVMVSQLDWNNVVDEWFMKWTSVMWHCFPAEAQESPLEEILLLVCETNLETWVQPWVQN